jgi:hypothetical protein
MSQGQVQSSLFIGFIQRIVVSKYEDNPFRKTNKLMTNGTDIGWQQQQMTVEIDQIFFFEKKLIIIIHNIIM